MAAGLRHSRQCKIVAVPARIAGLEIVSVHSYDPAISQVTEGATDWVRARVADYGQDRAAPDLVLTAGADRNCAAVNGHSIGNHLVGLHPAFVAFEGVGVSRVRVNGEGALDREGDLLVRPDPRSQKCSRPAPSPNGDRTRDDPTPAQRAGVNTYRGDARPGTGRIAYGQRALSDSRAAQIKIGGTQSKSLRAGLNQRSIALNNSGEIRAQVIASDCQAMLVKENNPVALQRPDRHWRLRIVLTKVKIAIPKDFDSRGVAVRAGQEHYAAASASTVSAISYESRILRQRAGLKGYQAAAPPICSSLGRNSSISRVGRVDRKISVAACRPGHGRSIIDDCAGFR